jgi:hypothetical protein
MMPSFQISRTNPRLPSYLMRRPTAPQAELVKIIIFLRFADRASQYIYLTI